MPQKLHDSPTRRVVQLRFYHPLPELDVVLHRPFPYLIAGHGELRAAGSSDLLRDREDLLFTRAGKRYGGGMLAVC